MGDGTRDMANIQIVKSSTLKAAYATLSKWLPVLGLNPHNVVEWDRWMDRWHQNVAHGTLYMLWLYMVSLCDSEGPGQRHCSQAKIHGFALAVPPCVCGIC